MIIDEVTVALVVGTDHGESCVDDILFPKSNDSLLSLNLTTLIFNVQDVMEKLISESNTSIDYILMRNIEKVGQKNCGGNQGA